MRAPLPSAFRIASAAFLLLAGTAISRQNQPDRQGAAPVTTQPITMNVVLVKGGTGANSGLIIGDREIIAVDAKMSAESVQEMLTEINKTVPFPVTRVILTHSDQDHVNGLPGFAKGLAVIAQEMVKADLIKAAADLPALQDYLPTVVFKDELKLKSGRRTVFLRHYGPAHTSGDTVVYVEPDRVAFVGDLVFIGRDPLVHGAKGGSFSGLVRTLKAILGRRPHIDLFIPGHGDMVTRDELERLLRSIETTQSRVQSMIAEGKSLDEIKRILKVEDQPAADGKMRFPSLVELIYLELTEKAKK
jgi:glyoxylase-like metal-dependent hydrolase (beta-lactamase superfamily II)